jgi:hypothetical protein
MEKELGQVNTNLKNELGRTNANLETLRGDIKELRGRFESSLTVARWGVGLPTAVAIAFAAGALGTYREFAEAKQTIDRIAAKVDAMPSLAPEKKP